MYKILIVDDENIVRVAMRNMVEYETLGFTVVGVAADGIEALKKVENLNPDLIITDLYMPNLDGLGLIHQLNENNFNGKIVILSNYDDFKIVREGLTAGAVDYILKVTVTTEEYVHMLNKVREILDSTKRQKLQERKMQIALEKYKEKEIAQMWKKVIGLDAKEMMTKIEEDLLEEILATSAVTIVFISMAQDCEQGELEREELELRHYAQMNIIKEVFLVDREAVVVLIEKNCFAAIVLHRKDKEYDWNMRANRLKSVMYKYINVHVEVLYDSCLLNKADVLSSKGRYITERKKQFYKKASCSMDLQKKNNNNEMKDDINESVRIQSLVEVIRRGNSKCILEELFCTMELLKKNEYDLDKFNWFWGNVLDELVSVLGISIENERRCHWKQNIACSKNYDEARVCLEMYLTECQQIYVEELDKKYSKEVQTIIQVIENNLGNKLTLSMIAEHVSLNESYMCTLFKKQVNMSIVHYINKLRMERAKYLLENTDMLVKNVAKSVGISDPFYFNRVYKKHFGYNPSETKNNTYLT